MAVLAFAALGSAIGAATISGTVLGMSGAAIGWAAGSMLGSALFPGSLPDQTGPRLGDVSPQSSDYGRPIARVFGRAGIGGNVIWASDLIEVETTTEYGGKGGPSGSSTEYAYFGNFAVAVCEGPCIVYRIWAGPEKRLIWDVSTPDQSEGGIIRTYSGSDTQLPDPLLESYLGVGKVPAYRGTCYVVFENLPLVNDGNRIPFLTIEVVSQLGGSTLQAVVTNLSALAGVGASEIDVSRLAGEVDGYVISRPTSVRGAIDALRPAYYFDAVESQSRNRVGPSRIVVGGYGNQIGTINTDTDAFEGLHTAPEYGTTQGMLAYDSRRRRVLWCNEAHPSIAYVLDAVTLALTRVDIAGGVPLYSVNYIGSLMYHPLLDKFIALTGSHASDQPGVGVVVMDAETFAVEYVGPKYTTGQVQTLKYAPGYTDRVYAGGTSACVVYLPPVAAPPSILGAGGQYTATDPTTGYLWAVRNNDPVSGQSTVYVFNPEDRRPVASIPLHPGNEFRAQGITYVPSTRCMVIGNHRPATLGIEGVVVSTASLTVTRLLEFSGGAVTWFGSACFGVGSGRIYTASSSGIARGAAILSESGSLLGSVSSGGDMPWVFDMIDMPAPLQQSSVIKYVPRGGPLQVVIPDADLAARDTGGDAGDNLQVKRQMDAELPASVTATYMMANTEYAPASQTARRLVNASGGEVVFDMPLVLTDEKAKHIASTHLDAAWTQRIGYTFALPRQYAYLEPTDVVAVKGRTMRITKISASPSGVLQCEAFADDANAYTHTVTVTETPDSGKVVAVQLPSRLELM